MSDVRVYCFFFPFEVCLLFNYREFTFLTRFIHWCSDFWSSLCALSTGIWTNVLPNDILKLKRVCGAMFKNLCQPSSLKRGVRSGEGSTHGMSPWIEINICSKNRFRLLTHIAPSSTSCFLLRYARQKLPRLLRSPSLSSLFYDLTALNNAPSRKKICTLPCIEFLIVCSCIIYLSFPKVSIYPLLTKPNNRF